MTTLKVDHANMLIDDKTPLNDEVYDLANSLNMTLFKYKQKCENIKNFCYSFIRLNSKYKLMIVVDPSKEENPYLMLYSLERRKVTRNIPYQFLKLLTEGTAYSAFDYIVDNVNSSNYRRLQMDTLTNTLKENIHAADEKKSSGR